MFPGLMSRWMIPLEWAAFQSFGNLDPEIEHGFNLQRLAGDPMPDHLALPHH